MLSEMAGKAMRRKEMLSWESYRGDVGAYLREHADGRWRETFVPLIRGLVSEQARNWEARFGVAFNVRDLFAAEALADYTLRFAQPIVETTAADISDILTRAERDGWGLARTRNALGVLFDRYISGGELTDEQREWFGERTPPHRRDVIARTETTRASGAGAQAMLAEWGAPRKEWLATRDARVRESHAGADGQVVPVAMPFSVGGHRMMYPGDMSLGAPLGEVANCRCAVAPVLDLPEGDGGA